MVRFRPIVLGFTAILLLLGAGWWLGRPQPAQGAATIPQWIRDLDAAHIGRQADPEARPFRLVGAGESYRTLQAALGAAEEGEIITILPGEYRECAVVRTNRITIRAQIPGSVTFNGRVCDSKGAIVLRGGDATIEGLRFRNIRVHDRNGAGVRVDRGSVTVRLTTFEDSETGLLSGDDAIGSVTIERSIFRRLGLCRPDEGACSHSLYVNRLARATIRDSLFEAGRGGHYIKSRTPTIEIVGNLIDDTAGRKTSYLIDLPFGAVGKIEANSLVKGTNADNRCCAIVVGAEGVEHDSTVLVSNNVAVNLADRPVLFLADFSGEARAVANRTDGWFIERTSFTLLDRCAACFLLN